MDIVQHHQRQLRVLVDLRLIHCLLVIVAWIVLRLYTHWHLGLFGDLALVDYQDVSLYNWWADTTLQSSQLPTDSSWQYPPAAIFMFLLPRLFVTPYGVTFVMLMLAFDALATLALIKLARRTGNWIGVWFWIIGIALTGSIALLRFDLVPTALVVVALGMLATSQSSYGFGILVGLAVAAKAWPVLALLGSRTFAEAIRAVVGVTVILVVTSLAAYVLFGNPFSFLANKAGRGLEVEAIAATPWYVWELISGEPFATVARNGSIEIDQPTADFVARLLFGAMAALGLSLAVWWVYARDSFRQPAASIDAVFTATLLYICFSEVLSLQYFIWLIGIAAVRFCLAGPRFPWVFALFFGITVVLNRLVLDNWIDLISEGKVGVVALIVRNLCLVAMAVYCVVRLVRATRWRSPFEPRPSTMSDQTDEDASG